MFELTNVKVSTNNKYRFLVFLLFFAFDTLASEIIDFTTQYDALRDSLNFIIKQLQ